MSKIIIAIDGHSACGKSTLAKAIAREMKYVYIDSGAMYRAVTLFAIQRNWVDDKGMLVDKDTLIENLDSVNISFTYNSMSGKSETYMNGVNIEGEIREMYVARSVSDIARIKEVREKLVEFQQTFGRSKGIVMDGRDIGTVVFPEAELKLWITANTDVRTARRYKELIEGGSKISVEEVRNNLIERDQIDSTRKESPLKRAEDAIDIDNSYLSKEDTLNQAIKLVEQRILEV